MISSTLRVSAGRASEAILLATCLLLKPPMGILHLLLLATAYGLVIAAFQ